jgi:DNA-binding CsgD family transcriptional regulator
MILPGLRQAAVLAELLAAARDAGTGDLLDQMPRAAVLVDAEGRVLRMNVAAERCIGEAIAITGGHLVAGHAASANEFRIRLARSVDAHRQAPTRSAGDDIMALPRPAARPLLAEIVPLGDAMQDLFRRARAIILLTDPDEGVSLDEAVCRMMFGLSPAESRLAIAVGGGQDVAGFADAAGLSIETVRKRLRSVLGKTGTRRQAELAALLGHLRRDMMS